MLGQLGIVVDLVEQGSGAIIGPTLLHDLAFLSPAPNHLLLRAALNAGADNTINVPSYIRALQAVQNSGFQAPWMVIQGGTEHGYQTLKGKAYRANMPNAPLGYRGDPLLNPYIDVLATKVVAFMRQLPDGLRPTHWFLWNEENEDSSTLQPGQIPQKPMSLSTTVYGGMLATLSKRIKAVFPEMVLIPGSMSCLAKFYTDPAGPWVGQYEGSALHYMNQQGINPPYLFESVSLNLEGTLTDAYVAGCAKQLTVVMRHYGLSGQTVIGECGEQNHGLVGVNWAPTLRSLLTHMSTVFLYCYGTLDPHLYGLRTVGIDAQGFIYPKEKTSFYDPFVKMIAEIHQQP